LIQIENNCFTGANKDLEKFVGCMMQQTKKIESLEKKFEFKLALIQNRISECFRKANNDNKAMELCKNTENKNIKSYLEEFVQ